jgi:hypothetical protein
MKIAEYPRVCNEKSFFTEEKYKKTGEILNKRIMNNNKWQHPKK